MKKENFVSLLLGTIGVILFGVGMCMCLLPQWGAFRQGVVAGFAGLAVMLVTVLVRRKMQNKPLIVFSLKSVGVFVLGVLGAMTLGVGMCMTMVWNCLTLPGIAVGCVGIFLLILLVPLCKGLEK